MSRILPIDELNVLIEKYETSSPDTPISLLYDLDDIIDELLDLFLLAIANGVVSINEQFGTDYQSSAEQIEGVVYEKIDGLTWKDRVEEWYENGGTGHDIVRIAETEAHRIGNEAANEAAKAAGATKKTWLTMMDERVRDTHFYLESISVGIEDDFYTYDNDHAPYPGAFGKAENNVNCRCEISYS